MKKTLLAAASLLTVLGCGAVSLPFDVPAPPAWNKVAECTAQGGVNLRKAPSTTAPKLVYNENSIEDYDVPVIYYGYWGNKTGGPVQSIKFEGSAPVVAEQAGWVKLLNEGPKRESDAWISAKFCKVAEITPITSASSGNRNFILLNVPGTDGTYGVYMVTDDMNGEASFYIGRLRDGKMVCPYVFNCSYYFDSGDGLPTFKKDEQSTGGYMYHSTNRSMSLVQTQYGEVWAEDINKLPAGMLEQVVSLATKAESSAIIYGYGRDYFILND